MAINTGCVLYKEGDYEAAAAKFKEAAALDSTTPVRQAAPSMLQYLPYVACSSVCMKLPGHVCVRA